MKYNRWQRNPNTDAEFAQLCRKHYAACVTYADALVGRLIGRLDALGLREDTLIILWGDHGWHLGEHAIWGKHALLRNLYGLHLLSLTQKLRKLVHRVSPL